MSCDRPGILAGVLLTGAALTALATTVGQSITARTQRALDALRERDFAQAERIALSAVQAQPEGAWRNWLIVATARERQRRYQAATDAYREFLAMCRCPTERAYAVERIRQCQRAADPPRPPLPASRRLSGAQRRRLAKVEGRVFAESSQHFLVRAYNAELAKLVAEQAEISLDRICKTILPGQVYPHSVDVYVWPTVGEYLKHASTAPEWAGGSFSIRRSDDGQVLRRIDLTQLDAQGNFDTNILDRTLPHEMCHLVLAEYFGDAHCPLALNEGLAMMAEATVDNRRVLLAGAALASPQGIPLPELLRITQCQKDNAEVFYAESFSLAAYLHARLAPGEFRDMLRHIKTGLPLDEALQRALYVPPDERFLARLDKAWQTEAIRQSQFLRALEPTMTAGR